MKSHYCWIKDLSKLLSKQCSDRNGKKFFCNRCLHYFRTQEKHDLHKVNCSKINNCAIELPRPGEDVLKFKNFEKKIPIP